MNTLSALILRCLIPGVILSTLFSSCSSGGSGLKPSTGAVNELLIITNDKAQWEGELGDTLRTFFAASQIGLPQPEPVFDIINIADEDFQEIFQKFHNIFIADINPRVTEPISEIRKDLFAEPQRVIKISAPDLASFYTEFRLRKDSFMKLFVDLERSRTLKINQLMLDFELSRSVEKKFGIYLPLPEGFYLAKETPDFMWLRHKTAKTRQEVELGILMYSMDYKDTIVFNPKHILKWRNLVTLEHIPGSVPLSYMKVATEDIPPVFNTITDFPGGYAVEARGLWEVENDFMGGPFINYTFIDKAKNKVITLDGYIYHPNEDKKGYLRQLEAIFFAAKFSTVTE